MDRHRPPEEMVMCVMTFGATCSPCLAQEVKNKNALEFRDQYPEAVDGILKRQYVDDYLGGADDVPKSIRLVKEINFIQQQGSFELCKWSCSNRVVFESIPENLRSDQTRSLNVSEEFATERVLGLTWDPNSDDFSFACKFPKIKQELLEGAQVPTKRDSTHRHVRV